MDKKIKFSDKPAAQKIIYGAVIAILCISAVVVGILSATLGKESTDEQPPVTDGGLETWQIILIVGVSVLAVAAIAVAAVLVLKKKRTAAPDAGCADTDTDKKED